MYPDILNNMTVRINSRFATADETADVLRVSSKRVKELRKLVDASVRARRANGISWLPPAATLKSLHEVLSENQRRSSTSFADSATLSTRPKNSKRSKSPLGVQKRGKKSNSSR
jgi:hypothetical protein